MSDPSSGSEAVGAAARIADQPDHTRRSTRWPGPLRVGVTLFGVILVVVALGSIFWTSAATDITDQSSLGPSSDHWLGTDSFGRDMLARSILGMRLSLLMALGATVMTMLLGVGLGLLLWTVPQRPRQLGTRLLEVAVAYPELLVAIVIAAILGAGPWQLMIAIGLANVPGMARLTTNLGASLHSRDFVTLATGLGVPRWRVVARHFLPNLAEPALIQSATVFSSGLVAMSALSFVGLGVQLPSFDLGRLLADALPVIYTRPLEVFGPAAFIVLVSFAGMLVGDGLAARADPRMFLASARPARPPRRKETSQLMATKANLCEVRDLRISTRSGTELVKGISFDIRRGEILGMVGESGSGKSLTAMTLARLQPDSLVVTAEALTIDGLNLLSKQRKYDLASRIALVYQDPGTTFNPALEMSGQLTSVLRAHQGKSGGKAKQILESALSTMRIADPRQLMASRSYQLSGGMRQRAMIAAALAAEADLLIADEPTTALDVTVQLDILRELKRLNRDNGLTVFFISHDIGVVQELCDRVLVMRSGEVIEEVAASALREGRVEHEYTRTLIEAVPTLESRQL